MQLTFLTPRVERLRTDGGFDLLHSGGLLGRLRRPVVLLARDLCAFSLFESAALPKSRRRQAATLHARTASPYVVGESTLVRAGDDFGIWWWNLERIAPALEGHFGGQKPVLKPETLAQPVGRDWRIVRLQRGYEAQLWRKSALTASSWRLQRYDIAAWAAFTRLQRDAAEAPDTPPPPSDLPIAYDGEAFAFAPPQPTREQTAVLAGGAVALTSVTAAVFLVGQGLTLRDEAEGIEAETATIQKNTPKTGATQALQAGRQKLTTFREIEERTNPISAVGAAVGILAYHDLIPVSVNAAEDKITIVLPYAAAADADDFIPEFEGSGYFHDVRPRTDATSKTMVIEMLIREAAPPLSANG